MGSRPSDAKERVSTQYSTPTTGSTVTLTRAAFVRCLINPAGTIATLTVTPATPRDGDHLLVSTKQTITTLTLTGIITGALAANTCVAYVYNATAAAWFRAN